MSKIIIEDIEIEVVKKNIKNINLSVHPPFGDVRISAPERMNDESLKSFVNSRIAWIRKQRGKYMTREGSSEKGFVTGEYHSLYGNDLMLEVHETSGRQYAEVGCEGKINMFVRKGSSAEKREKLLYDMYRELLKDKLPECIKRWETVIGVSVNQWGVKLMKTRWGTCNIKSKRIWINLELAKKGPRCLEYIVVHELTHLLERYHNKSFYGYMDRFLPEWKEIRKELNGMA